MAPRPFQVSMLMVPLSLMLGVGHILRISQVAHALIAQRALGLNGLGPRFSTHWGNIIFFLFSRSKASDANIGLLNKLTNLVCCTCAVSKQYSIFDIRISLNIWKGLCLNCIWKIYAQRFTWKRAMSYRIIFNNGCSTCLSSLFIVWPPYLYLTQKQAFAC